MKRAVLILLLSACVEGTGSPPPPPDGGAAADAGPLAPDGSVTPDAAVPDGGFDAGHDAGAADSRQLSVAGSALQGPDGGALTVRGAISCCMGGYGWPLIDDAWIALTASRQVNFLHARLGPFLTSSANGETDWAQVGGGYVEAAGQADLSQFNPAFWTRVTQLLAAARANGQWVEVDLVDGWAVKHCDWGDLPGYSAWAASGNLQGENVCASAGTGALLAGSRADAWVRQVVAVTGAFDNVLYQDGNEVGLVPGYRWEWTQSLVATVRDEEARRGYGRHLFGTNSGDGTAIALPAVDYVELHQNHAATLAQCGQKPCLVNEYNPNPPLSPAAFEAQVCAARSQGTVFWYWRHGQSAADLLSSLDLQMGDCP